MQLYTFYGDCRPFTEIFNRTPFSEVFAHQVIWSTLFCLFLLFFSQKLSLLKAPTKELAFTYCLAFDLHQLDYLPLRYQH